MQSFLFRTVHSLENRPVFQLRFPQRAVPVPIVDKQRGTADIAGGSPLFIDDRPPNGTPRGPQLENRPVFQRMGGAKQKTFPRKRKQPQGKRPVFI